MPSGRRPKPTRLKVLQGNPGRRPLNRREPKPRQGIPEMPEWLNEYPVAVEKWNKTVAVQGPAGVITWADSDTLERYCYLYSQFRKLTDEIKVQDYVSYAVKADSLGNEIVEAKTNPRVLRLEKIMTELRHLAGLLGLDPSSRSRIQVPPPGAEDPWEDF